jgi:hypothetical protein
MCMNTTTAQSNLKINETQYQQRLQPTLTFIHIKYRQSLMYNNITQMHVRSLKRIVCLE